ncbi:MAG: beta-ketoacyl synthase N-terminal-like domain-containing protein [Gammaproteobacteria bacterium]
MTTRVVVTGYGCISAAGENAQQAWQMIKQGKSAIDKIKKWDVENWPCQLGGELKDFNPRDMVLDRKLLKLLSFHDIVGLGATRQAIEHSELLTYRDGLAEQADFNDRVGVYVGSPGNKYHQQYDFASLLAESKGDMKYIATELFSHVHPMWLLRVLPNNVLAYTGVQYGFKGANQNITNHAVSGLQAIIEAYHAIKAGTVDRAVVISYDNCVEAQGSFYYGNAGLLSNTAVKPFDQDHDGTILADGAGAILLESETAAKERQATVYAEILGGSSMTEAAGIFALHEDGDGLNRAIRAALHSARVGAEDVGFITAHGNGNVRSDSSEAQAIADVFGDNTVPVTALKWAFGHTLIGSGVIETIFTLLALQDKYVPGIATLRKKAQSCQALNISAEAQVPRSQLAMVIARGFSSMNTCLLLKSFS